MVVAIQIIISFSFLENYVFFYLVYKAMSMTLVLSFKYFYKKDCQIVRQRDADQPNIHNPTSNIYTHVLPFYLESYDVIFAIEFSFNV